MNTFTDPTMDVLFLSEEATEQHVFLVSGILQENELGIVGKITKPQ